MKTSLTLYLKQMNCKKTVAKNGNEQGKGNIKKVNILSFKKVIWFVYRTVKSISYV